jgi:uracil-DNA glycosylase family 4
MQERVRIEDVYRIFGVRGVYLMGELRELPLPEHREAIELARERSRVRSGVLGCRACPLVDGCSGPVPYSGPSGPSGALMAAVGEAPGPEEDKAGKPFVGKSGKLLRAIMSQVGIDPMGEVFWLNVVSCFPNDEGKVAKPTKESVAACEDNLFGQLDIAEVQYVLLVGAFALNQLIPEAKINRVHGRVFAWGNFVCMGITHPASAFYGNKKEVKDEITTDLAAWRYVITGQSTWEQANFEHAHKCFFCGQYSKVHDNDGIGYCEKHYKKKVDPEFVSNQDELF